MINIGMKEGSIKYSSYTSGNVSFSKTSVYGKNFVVDGVTLNASVGAIESYSSITNFNKETLVFNFNYDIENVKLFGKTVQNTGNTSDLSSMVTIDVDKRRVYLKSTLNISLNDVYLMIYVNGPWQAIVEYDLIQNLTNCTSNIIGDKIDGNEEIILTCDTGFIFDEIPTITIGDSTLNFNLNSDLTVATITIDIIDDVYLAQDSDFVKVNDRWIYRGAALEVEIPTHINGELVTSTRHMFNGSSTYQATPVTKVVLNHSNVTNMYAMFFGSNATSLDLSSFDTSNVTNMSYMFYGSNATTLDLSSFDTSNVTNMSYMFYGSKATTLDLSSFNTSNVTNMTSMFSNSAATVGYARTQADADRFNASSGKPTGLNFVVKPDVYLAQDSDLTVATVTVDVTDSVVINAVARRDIRVYITGVIENATCNYVDGEFADLNKPIIISANNGYTFKESYTLKWNITVQTFTNETTRLVYNLSEYTTDNTYLNGNYIATKEVEQVGTFVNLYNVNQSELTELSKKRLITNADGQITDYGQFINSLYVLPFNLPSDMLGDRASIILGNLDSNVESTLISTYLFDVDAGSIEVPLKYNNIYDFVNTECILHLPFLNKIYLNTEYVIGQTITLDFTVDLYSGSLTINVTSSFNNKIIASVKGLIGMNIPFIQKSNNSVINSVSNIYKNNIDRCFIEVNRNIPYTKNNNVFGGAVVEYGRIGDYTGYLECDSLVLETNATNQEQEEIKNLLRNGVFI